MTADSKRRSFPEFARILAKEPGWGDADDVLQELLGGFLLDSLEVTWPRGDVPSRPDGVHLMTIRHEMAYGPDTGPNPSVRRVTVPVKTPPQEAVSRDEWLQAFRAFGEQDQRMGADWSLLADIPISEYPPLFRQAYIDWLYTTDAAVGRWFRETGRPVPGWLKVHREDEQPKAPPKTHHRPGQPTLAPQTPVPLKKNEAAAASAGATTAH